MLRSLSAKNEILFEFIIEFEIPMGKKKTLFLSFPSSYGAIALKLSLSTSCAKLYAMWIQAEMTTIFGSQRSLARWSASTIALVTNLAKF